jgi:hypothetical protein
VTTDAILRVVTTTNDVPLAGATIIVLGASGRYSAVHGRFSILAIVLCLSRIRHMRLHIHRLLDANLL